MHKDVADGHGTMRWKCSCTCGGAAIAYSYDLRVGKTQSCGCFQRERTSLASSADLVGQVFGRLTVISRDGSDRRGQARWICQCECGKICSAVTNLLTKNNTRSCHCLRAEKAREVGKNTRLFESGDPEGVRALLYSIHAKGEVGTLKEPMPYEKWLHFEGQECHYCGMAAIPRRRNKNEPFCVWRHGLDRVDNNRGYVDGNVVACCIRCNYSKRNSPVEEFLQMCRMIASRYPAEKG